MLQMLKKEPILKYGNSTKDSAGYENPLTDAEDKDPLWKDFNLISLKDKSHTAKASNSTGNNINAAPQSTVHLMRQYLEMNEPSFNIQPGRYDQHQNNYAPGAPHFSPQKPDLFSAQKRILSPTLGPSYTEYLDPGNFSLSAPNSPIHHTSHKSPVAPANSPVSSMWAHHSDVVSAEPCRFMSSHSNANILSGASYLKAHGVSGNVVNENVQNELAVKSIQKSQKKQQMDIEAMSRFASIKLSGLVGNVLNFCRDQYGCRFLQKMIDDHGQTAIEIILEETLNNFVDMMMDPFGNYLCQKLIETSTSEQKTLIVKKVSSGLCRAAKNIAGTRAAQKLVEHLDTPEQIKEIVLALEKDLINLVKDLNGNHVIQKCLALFPPEANAKLYEILIENCVEVSAHRHGCCVMQRCIDHASPEQRRTLINVITINAVMLVQDPFGNYVIQYVLEKSDLKERDRNNLMQKFCGLVYELSMQKFSSNVIEKCLKSCNSEIRQRFVMELMKKSRLEKLIKDSFGNYVLQTAIDVADEKLRNEIIDMVKPLLAQVRNTPSGKRILTKVVQYESQNQSLYWCQPFQPQIEPTNNNYTYQINGTASSKFGGAIISNNKWS